MAEPNPTGTEGRPGEFEPLDGWPYKSDFQQSPVDHFSIDRLPARSRRKAMLLCPFLGIWGVQSFYLRRPAAGWSCFVMTKVGVIAGLLLLAFGEPRAGLVLLIGLPLLSWLFALWTLLRLGSGAITSDGMGKPLVP